MRPGERAAVRRRVLKAFFDEFRRLPHELADYTLESLAWLLGATAAAVPVTGLDVWREAWRVRGRCVSPACGRPARLAEGFCPACKSDLRPHTDAEIRALYESRPSAAKAARRRERPAADVRRR